MKTFLTIMIAIIFSACGGDNAYDGETGLIQATQEKILLNMDEEQQLLLHIIQSELG